MIKGWKNPIVTSEDVSTSIKPEADWTKVENDEAIGKTKALNIIFKGVDKNMLRLINTCSEVKEA